ncbi:hypothetical protein [Halioxenophilus sp. WMMB6]|uniref:MMPL family transporter n=1 Tax=Halioxenophilus sp. WMMB6 TaxID=3073815 RepID=UPI00295EDFE2|nr:hypothetical protein [Halioxenophilus sp. WMMB6]
MPSEWLLRWLTPKLWLVMMALLSLLLALQWLRGIEVETDILALLPVTEQDPIVAEASNRFNQSLAQRHLLVVGAESLSQAVAAADQLADALAEVPGIAELEYRINDDRQRAMLAPYLPYRGQLLDADTRALLQTQGGEALVRQNLQLLYSPMAAVNSAVLADDPLLLFYRFALGLAQGQEKVSLRQGVITAEHHGRHYVLLNLTLADSPFSMTLQREFLPAVAQALAGVRAQFPEVELLNVGMVRYAAAGVASAQKEISTIGIGSLLGVVLLLVVVFRAGKPLLVSLLPIGVGFLAAFVACQWLFGSVHLLTLVFGASLIGISIDYSFHYFCDRLGGGSQWRGDLGVRNIFNGILLGLITSVLGYASLCFAPFPGMQQLALFSTVGLTAAFLTVVCLFPYLAGGASGHHESRWLLWSGLLSAGLRWRQPWGWLATLGLVVFAVSGVSRLQVDDDIRLLQSVPANLRAEEQRLAEILGVGLSNQFLLVEGRDAEQVLARESALIPQLQALQGQGSLARFDALSAHLPTVAQQQSDWQLVKRELAGQPQLLANYAAALGLAGETIDHFQQRYQAGAFQPLNFEQWWQSDGSRPWRHLWLGKTERGYASVIALYAAKPGTLAPLADGQAGVSLVDKVSDISTLLSKYRQRSALLVMLSYTAIYLLLCLRYGPRLSLRIVTPPLAAVILALAVLGWTGHALNIFHLLAMLLVLGIGIDYTLFLEEGSRHRQRTLLAIILSALTTLLSFGLLALSETPAVSAFGETVLVGILVSLLLAPILCGQARADGAGQRAGSTLSKDGVGES